MTACPAGVNYAELFEHARAEAEQSGVLSSPQAQFDPRHSRLRWLFMDLNRLQLAGRVDCAFISSSACKRLSAAAAS